MKYESQWLIIRNIHKMAVFYSRIFFFCWNPPEPKLASFNYRDCFYKNGDLQSQVSCVFLLSTTEEIFL